jgi:hypothetical protein
MNYCSNLHVTTCWLDCWLTSNQSQPVVNFAHVCSKPSNAGNLCSYNPSGKRVPSNVCSTHQVVLIYHEFSAVQLHKQGHEAASDRAAQQLAAAAKPLLPVAVVLNRPWYHNSAH